MQETTQPNIAFRFIPGSIDVTDNLVQYAADIYNDARVVILYAGDWLDHFAAFLPACLRRPLACTASFLGRALFAVTGRICRSAWRIYNRGADHAWRQAAPRSWLTQDGADANIPNQPDL